MHRVYTQIQGMGASIKTRSVPVWAFSASGEVAASGRVAMFGGKCGCPSWEQRSYWHLTGSGQEVRNVSQCPTVHRSAGPQPLPQLDPCSCPSWTPAPSSGDVAEPLVTCGGSSSLFSNVH